MHIVILGAGAIGRLLGVYLRRCDHDITFVEPRTEVVEAINGAGVGFMEQDATDPDAVVRVPARAVAHADEIRECDLVLLAVKSFDTLTAIRAASHLVSEESPVITLQTGLGNIEQMERVVDRRAIIGGFTFMAATALGPGIVRHGGTGKTYLGELDSRITDRLRNICDIFNRCGLSCTPVHRFMGRLWCKVIVYSAINSLSSILRVKNGQLIESMESITLMKRLIDEGRTVAEAHAVDLVFPDLYELLFTACRTTSDNISSMLQDILAGQRTEIDAQCGALVRFGTRAGISVPTHQTMVELVRLIERKETAIAA
ncbi:ketopantoate reductase family protein [Thermodesulfobacteriota bacterium B35]